MSDQSGNPSGYAPMPGEPARGPVTRGPAPSSVRTAVRLMFLNVAIGVLGIIALFATKDTLKKEILKHHRSYSTSKLDHAVNGAVAIGTIFAIVFIVLYVLLALQVGKGRNWARIVTWILAGLGVLAALSTFAQPEPAASRVLSILGGLVDLAIIIFLARRPSNEYFAKTA
jgi:hypothetical protein